MALLMIKIKKLPKPTKFKMKKKWKVLKTMKMAIQLEIKIN